MGLLDNKTARKAM